ncbi:MarR family transcriptional regulator [Halomonas sp.]|uniref:MarR family transcriptional regulator n=1 Tax=Halomonas sp. TaxID=1486246 RepID=UPI0035678D33
MAKRRSGAAYSKWPGGFLALPKVVLEHEDFRTLSPNGFKVLLVLGAQYNGKNNGDLSATSKVMEAWGGISHTTLAKALKELQDRRLICKTRDNQYGRAGARCALYAITWQPIDPCDGKLDVADTDMPPRKWRA